MRKRRLENGILFHDEQAVFAVGQAYWPSFHPKKTPVPPDRDPVAEMRRDLAAIRAAGFNLLRTAAIGEIRLEGDAPNETVDFSAPFVDRMAERARELDLAMMVRIQGYSVNLHDWQNTRMVRHDGVPISPRDWSNFILDSTHHEGIQADNRLLSAAVARHFASDPGVVAFITYNEPHYPADGFYDYHPAAVAAYRRWLADSGRMEPDAAASHEPPRRRPGPGESTRDWVDWRMFSLESMTDFLLESAAVTKTEGPDVEQLTCLTPNMLEFDNAVKGVDYFRVAEGMDILGLTLYKNAAGADYDTTAMILACAESAAALCGKHFWMVEIDSATNIPLRRFLQQNLLALGMGTKGMVFYQWRGDHPFPGDDTPEPNGFGFVNHDNTPTDHYAEKIAFVSFMNRLSPYLTQAERLHSECGILFSHHAALHADALDNAREFVAPRHRLGGVHHRAVLRNSCIASLRRIHGELRRENIQPAFVEARHLKENRFRLKSLYVPAWDLLGEAEQAQVLDFQAGGGAVWRPAEDVWQAGLVKCGYEILHRDKTKFDVADTLAETLEEDGIAPTAEVSTRALAVEWLRGGEFLLAMVVNIHSRREVVDDARLTPHFAFQEAVWEPVDGEAERLIPDADGCLRLPPIRYGGALLFLRTTP